MPNSQLVRLKTAKPPNLAVINVLTKIYFYSNHLCWSSAFIQG